MLTIVQIFRNCGICCRWKTPHKKKVKQHLVDRKTSQPRRKSDRIAARPVASMAEQGGLLMSASKSERDTSSNEEQSEEQSNSTSYERQQRNVLLKGVHSLQNVYSIAKEVKNLGNKRIATRTPDQV